jgi:Tetratricopeptide repeat
MADTLLGAAASRPVTPALRTVWALWLLPTLALASPQLPERARWGAEGELRWESPDGVHVLGRAGAPNPCGFESGRTVVDAVWEGNVLVGSLRLCTSGAACPSGEFAYFGIYNGADGTLVSDVVLPPGCASAGLDGRRLVLAARAKLRTDLPRHIALGTQALEERRGRAARLEFDKALAAKEDPAHVYMGLGQAAVLLGENDAAIEAYKKAFLYAPGSLVLYNLACAQARKGDLEESFQALEDAIKRGFPLAEDMARDPDLHALQTQDPVRFASLLQRARANATRKPARPSGRGEP